MWVYEELYDLYHSPSILSDQIKKKKMGWTCGTYWGKVRRRFWWGNPRKIDHLRDPRYRRNTIMNFEEIGWDDVDWVDMAYDRDGPMAGS